jgi:hypothetical protein
MDEAGDPRGHNRGSIKAGRTGTRGATRRIKAAAAGEEGQKRPRLRGCTGGANSRRTAKASVEALVGLGPTELTRRVRNWCKEPEHLQLLTEHKWRLPDRRSVGRAVDKLGRE